MRIGGLMMATAVLAGMHTLPARAFDLTSISSVAGAWDMALNDTNRRCRMMLRTEQAGAGHALGMPAGCRRALPILSDVDSWTLPGNDRLGLAAQSGAVVVLEFASTDGAALIARGPEGETYELSSNASGQTAKAPGLQLAQAPAAQPAPGAPAGGFRPVAPASGALSAQRQPTPAPAANPPAPVPGTVGAQRAAAAPAAATANPNSPAANPPTRPAEVGGRYAVLRDGNKDTGCMVTLDEKGRGPKNSMRAFLAPACRDQGIVIFDPTGWQLERGHLKLHARKGHDASFILQTDGTWQKDPKAPGKPLGFKKI